MKINWLDIIWLLLNLGVMIFIAIGIIVFVRKALENYKRVKNIEENMQKVLNILNGKSQSNTESLDRRN